MASLEVMRGTAGLGMAGGCGRFSGVYECASGHLGGNSDVRFEGDREVVIRLVKQAGQ